jgi:hypothetical protein
VIAVYLPCYTVCSQCGSISGTNPAGPAFPTREQAEKFLRIHPNPNKGWGNGTEVVEIKLACVSSLTVEKCSSCNGQGWGINGDGTDPDNQYFECHVCRNGYIPAELECAAAR